MGLTPRFINNPLIISQFRDSEYNTKRFSMASKALTEGTTFCISSHCSKPTHSSLGRKSCCFAAFRRSLNSAWIELRTRIGFRCHTTLLNEKLDLVVHNSRGDGGKAKQTCSTRLETVRNVSNTFVLVGKVVRLVNETEI